MEDYFGFDEEREEKKRAELQRKRLCLREAGVAYSVAAALPVLLSFFLSLILSFVLGEAAGEQTPDWELYLLYLLPQLAFLGTAALWFFRSKQSVKQVFCGCKWQYFPIAVALEFGLLFSLSSANGIFIAALEKLGYVSSETPVPDISGWNVLPALLVIALLPAFCEELLFRGILSRSMHESGWGLLPTCLIAGAMFSLFHGSPEQTVYQFLCGACFTLVAVRAGSVLPTMVAHFLNNAVIIILDAAGATESMPDIASLILFFVSFVCLMGSLVYLLALDKRNGQGSGVKEGKIFFLASAVGLLLCAFEWGYALLSGFIGG